MTAIFGTESFETGPAGDAITDLNTQFVSVQTGWQFADVPTPPSNLGLLCARVDVAAAATSYGQASFTATPTCVLRGYFRPPAVPATGSVTMASVRGGGALMARLDVVDAHYVLRNGATQVWASAGTVLATAWNRFEWWVDAAGFQRLRIYRGSNHNGTVADEASPDVTYTGGNLDIARFGPSTNTLTTPWTAYYDGLIISDTTWPGPALATGGSVTVDAGTDQVGVEPWKRVTLTATVGGSGVISENWRQIAGPNVALTVVDPTTVTFETPGTIAGAALQFQHDVATTAGTVSDVVGVTVRAVDVRYVNSAGQIVPLRVRVVPGVPVPAGWNPADAWVASATWADH